MNVWVFDRMYVLCMNVILINIFTAIFDGLNFFTCSPHKYRVKLDYFSMKMNYKIENLGFLVFLSRGNHCTDFEFIYTTLGEKTSHD